MEVKKTDLLRQAKRAMATPRTQAVAESKQLENFVNGVTVMTIQRCMTLINL